MVTRSASLKSSSLTMTGLISMASMTIYRISIFQHVITLSVDDFWLKFKSIVLDAISLLVSQFKTKSHKLPRWYSPEIKHHLDKLRTLRKKFRSHPSETTYQKLLTGEQCLETRMCSKLRLTSNQKKDTVSRVSWFWQQKFHEFGCMTLGWTISCQNHHHIHQKCRISAQNVTYILEPERNTSPPLGSSLKKSSPVSL